MCVLHPACCAGLFIKSIKSLRMLNHEFNTIPVADGTELDVYTAFPEGQGAWSAIIILQEAFGVNHHMREVAERFCREGYAVIAPDLFHRTGRRLEIAYTDFAAAMPHYQAITQESLTADLNACYTWLQDSPNIVKEKMACVGYCLGGRVSFLANALLPLAAAVSYYGGGLEQIAGELASSLHGPHLFYWGGKDTHITQDKVETTLTAVKTAGKDYASVLIAYADHGFNCDERSSYHPLASKEAWAHTLAFLENRLK